MLAPKAQQTISPDKMSEKILALTNLSPSAQALQSAFRGWDDEHRLAAINEVKRILGNFAFAHNFGINCAFELLAIYIAHKEGWRDLSKEGY